MKRKKSIAWMLVIVSMVMLIAAVLPHHHHQHILCLHGDVTACDCSCEGNQSTENHAAESHHACGDGCVTNFQSVHPNEVEMDLSVDYSTCQLLFTLADVLSVPLPVLLENEAYSPYYTEMLYATCIQHVMGLRAPPAC